PEPKLRWPWTRAVGYLGAGAALLFLGWLLGRHWEPLDPGAAAPPRTVEVIREKTIEVFRDKIVNVESQADRQLFAALLERNARLVQSKQVSERLGALLDMADDCRQHALKLIEEGPRESLPFTIELYTHLLREGVAV